MSDENTTRERQYSQATRGEPRVLHGTVVSTKGAKTLTVSIERRFRHAKYGKYIRRHSKVYAHDEHGAAGEGDYVKVVECRPMSKLKRFRLSQVVKKAGS